MINDTDLHNSLAAMPNLLEAIAFSADLKPYDVPFFNAGSSDWQVDFSNDESLASILFVHRGLKRLDYLDLLGVGPQVLVELIGSKHSKTPEEPRWVCRRMVCPENDDCFTTSEGHGDTLVAAVARCLLMQFSPRLPLDTHQEGR